jgi:hypothetical protein
MGYNMDLIDIFPGLFGLVIFVMYDIGDVMMMGAMLCYFNPESTQTVVHNQDL